MIEHNSLNVLLNLVATRKATVGIIGAGYAGLPLACAFANAGFKTLVTDSDRGKIQALRQGSSYVEDNLVNRMLPNLVASGALEVCENIEDLARMAEFIIICVPTQLNDTTEPDLSYVIRVTEAISQEIRPGKFVVLESSVYPGTTDELLKPILERSGHRAGVDFGLAHSPERIDYNNPRYTVLDIPKIAGGITPLCTRICAELYASILRAPVVPVSSARVAEATKMLENTYRFVNIALVNELAILHERLGIDFFEVINAAATKPFGFQAFYPGPGVGGHCIPKDPIYLSYKARQVGMPLKLVEVSTEINKGMVDHILEKLEQYLLSHGKFLRESKVVLLGLAFKADVADTRNSPSIVLAERLRELGANLSAYDPNVHLITTKFGNVTSERDLESAVKKAHILILATPHSAFGSIDLMKLRSYMNMDAVIFDTRGFWSPAQCKAAGFNYLAVGRP